MAANILDPRMIDPTKPLSCIEIKTPSLTADSIVNRLLVTNNLSSTTISVSTLNVTNISATTANISAINVGQITVKDGTFTGTVTTVFTASVISLSSYTFTNNDNSKVFHFDTDTQPSVTALFVKNNISNGFNIGIVNTGLGVINLCSDFIPTLNAPNTFNSVRHSGMFIYRVNDQLYGIGIFE